MKWMGWNCVDLYEAPQETVRQIVTMINEEVAALNKD